jgi:uncharacterized protein (TIGR03435 family)
VIAALLMRQHAEDTFGADLEAIFDLSAAARQTPPTLEDYRTEISRRLTRLRGGRNAVLTGIRQEISMTELSTLLESSLGTAVIDETGARGDFALNVETEAQTSQAFLEALAAHAGLVFTPARRELPVLVVKDK